MNKQEMKEFFINLTGNLVVVENGEKYIELGSILYMIDKIEPQKPVIPKFVADWIESCKVSGFSLRLAMSHWSMSEKLDKWMEYSENQEIFAKAWFYGYTVEKPKLYTVEIPNNDRVSLKIRLSDDQLEHIANGGMITLYTSQPLTCEKITISPSLVNDVANPNLLEGLNDG